MKRRDLLLALAALAPARARADAEYRPLFNGRNLDGWIGDSTLWHAEGGLLVGRTPDAGLERNEFLATRERFADFIFKAEVRFEGHNSGIQFRSRLREDGHAVGYQADIGPEYWGSLYHELGRGPLVPYRADRVEPYFRRDGWNEYVITCVGERVTLRLNGVVTADLRDPEGERRGVFALQLHSGPAQEVFFRDLRVRER